MLSKSRKTLDALRTMRDRAARRDSAPPAAISDPAPLEPAPLGSADLEPGDLEPARLEPAPLEPAGLGPADLEPGDLEPARLGPAGFGPASIEPAPREPARLADAAGFPQTVVVPTAQHRQVGPRVAAHRRATRRRITARGAGVSVAAATVIAVGLVAGANSPDAATNRPSGLTAADIAARDQAAQRADRSDRTAGQQPSPTAAGANTGATGAAGTAGAAGAATEAAAGAPTTATPVPAPDWVSPMPDVGLTSCFGPRWGTVHQGIDFAGAFGTPIRAVGAGTVIAAGWVYSGYGISVVIDHGNGYLSHYAHASQVLVAVGQRVTPGETIALEGSTGDSTGPHLHFEIHQGLWNQIDPAPWLRARGVQVGC